MLHWLGKLIGSNVKNNKDTASSLGSDSGLKFGCITSVKSNQVLKTHQGLVSAFGSCTAVLSVHVCVLTSVFMRVFPHTHHQQDRGGGGTGKKDRQRDDDDNPGDDDGG